MAIEAINATTYKVDNLGDIKAKLKIGGSEKDKFVPNLNASFFDDEFYFNLNRKDKVVTNQTASSSPGKVSQKIDTETDEYYIDADGNFKWDIVFDELPKKLSLEWEMEYADGINFLYQPELTAEEISNGAFRPDNVIGSYAVYCNKANNKYKTGKICHIYRPFVIDANNKKEWAKLEIKNKKLTITLPESFMQTAVYPVRLDPILGYNTAGASTQGGVNSIYFGTTSIASDSGNISMWHISIAANASSSNIKLGMYDPSDVDGDPNNSTLIEYITINAPGASDDVSQAGGGGAIVASRDYWLGFITEGSDPDIKYDTDSGGWYKPSQTYGDAFLDPAPANFTGNNNKFSIWIEYTSGGGATTPIAVFYHHRQQQGG